MSKHCARCEKIVYPTEELKCLDKVWHKLCFKCKDCGMALNMRTYKGFNKEPYCEAHIPKAKATTMAETPELRRIAENTKLQSNVNYHADFEKSKGKFTQVADDPETLRIKQNTKIISNVAYHGDLQRKEDMEKRRQLNENGNTVDTPVLRKEVANNAPPPASNNYSSSPVPTQQPVSRVNELQNSGNPQQFISPYSARTSQTLIYSSESGGVIDSTPYRHIGSVNDMDPLNHNYGSLGSAGAGGGGGAASALGRVYRALYDYEAQDEDEVSFLDGDLIVNVTSIDRGWMTGQVERTGQTGMLPANYVEVVNI